MGYVRGPFIEYECTKCGTTVLCNAPRDQSRLVEEIADKNAHPNKRICAGCWNQDDDKRGQ